MNSDLISRSVLTELREHFVQEHVLRTIRDAFGNQGIKRETVDDPSLTGERRQLVEEYYASLDLGDISDANRLLRVIEREIAFCQPGDRHPSESPLKRVVIGLEQEGYVVEGYRISRSARTPLVTLQGHLEAIDSHSITDHWSRMLPAATTDPEDAITAAQALLESTCKSILDELGIRYEDKWDAGHLYRKTAQALQLSPKGYSEQIFKQILGGLFSISNGLAAVRNAFGDAHGKGKRPVRPTPRHARLAVNAAGALAVFLLETLETRRESDSD